MNVRDAFAKGLKNARKASKLTQEDFSNISSRTYISSLERATKGPTLEKIDEIANVLQMHPLTLYFLTYLKYDNTNTQEDLFNIVREELKKIDLYEI